MQGCVWPAAPLTPGTSENIQANPRLYEVRNPAAPSVYCECEFHDTIQGARWIVEHTTDIGEAIAKGLCEYLGVKYVPARQESPKPAETTQGDTLYRVQVGAFAVRANAEKMLDRLKRPGLVGSSYRGRSTMGKAPGLHPGPFLPYCNSTWKV